jgi:hypothetical protein
MPDWISIATSSPSADDMIKAFGLSFGGLMRRFRSKSRLDVSCAMNFQATTKYRR